MNTKLKIEMLENRIVPAGMQVTLNDGMISGWSSQVVHIDTMAAPTPAPQPGTRTICNENLCYVVVTLD